MKYWKMLTAAAMLLGLTACGGGGSEDKNDPPPSASTTPPVSVVVQRPVVDLTVEGNKDQPQLVVNFTANANGQPVTGLTLSGVTLAQLITDYKMSPGSSMTGTRWQSMFNKYRSDASPNGETLVYQASTSDSKNYIFTEEGNGSYTLKLFKVVFSPSGITHDPVLGTDSTLAFDLTRTSRLGFQFKDASGQYLTFNPTYDWVPAGGDVVLTREMVDTEANCYSCHDQKSLALHGGGRFTVQYCVTCHNPGTTGLGKAFSDDAEVIRFPLDMPNMVHKIHRGKDLPSVNEGEGLASTHDQAKFMIYGKSNGEHLYAENLKDDPKTPGIQNLEGVGVFYPQDTRNCSTCHDASNPKTPDAKNWFEKPGIVACKSCHDDIKVGHANTTTLTKCDGCHSATNTTKNAQLVHEGRLNASKAGAATLQVVVDHASYDVGSKQVSVDVRVLKDDAIITYEELKPYIYDNAAAGVLVNWNNGEGNGLAESKAKISLDPTMLNAACKEDGAGFHCTKVIDGIAPDNIVPADATLVVTNADWALCVDRYQTSSTSKPALMKCAEVIDNLDKVHRELNPNDRYVMAAPAVHAEFDQGGNPILADEFVDKTGADMATCKNCHKDQEFHKTKASHWHSVKEFVQCNSCHNATRGAWYAGMPGDLKYHVHSYHNYGAHRAGAAANATHGATYPATKTNCETCHTQEQYNLTNMVNARPSAVAFGSDGKPNGLPNLPGTVNKYYSPTLVVCSSCHLKSALGSVNPDAPAEGDDAADHMKDYGAVYGAATPEDALGREQCDTCHGIGGEQGVDKVHNVFDFR